MMKHEKIICLLFLVFCFTINVSAQELTKIESQYSSMLANLRQEAARLDSLKNILDIRAKKINDEKKKSKPDENLIINLMSGSANLSNEIESRQNNVEALERKIENVKHELNKSYSAKIDSLDALEKSNEYKGNKEALRSLVLFYTEKKLLVAPKISMLSFHPDKILEIDLKKITNPEERKLYEDYFQNALAEVNKRLSGVNESIKEAGTILSLQKKTNKFLEETEFDYSITPRTNASQTEAASADGFGNVLPETSKDVRVSYATNAIEYSMLLNQLNFQPMDSKLKWIVSIDSKHSIPSLYDYNELLKEVKKRLQEYKLILTHKLSAVK